MSRLAYFLGPGEADGGITGAKDFARRHRTRGRTPTVRLVVTDQAVVVLPRFPRDELTLPLVALRFVDVDPDRKAGGVRLTTREGRCVLVGLAKGTQELANALHGLRATIERPWASAPARRPT